MVKTRIILVALIGLLVWAPAAHADVDQAQKFVTDLGDRVISILSSTQSNGQKEETLKTIFRNAVDTNWMGRFVLGRYYRTIKPEQQERYLNLYEEFLIQMYIPRFQEFAGQELQINQVHDAGKGEYFVYTEIVPKKSEPPVRVDYRIRKNGDSFKIVDIVGEGISLITTQRSDFGGLISRKGSDYFIDKLEQRVRSAK